ncbi:hypothetical protein A2673_00420 [Candidatus Kaiserbacteria bacterium RIFCSPHIGHO2_01_FULL_50_13]|uniref:Uncharacterized protein n=1 Tax=Candidatus Kaiserbacteria bacterium RIFCSPLOWO2_01_FULL_50_24 TaxID=1798507 RepID=A0A1F6EI23_9BACT|nr:MAG: hypothetical protein A2673_00420 [Candidatus Kaiserbacteria bacterium RIFCSPHIGHO2_01_FULL_50_13]OGG73291.1 MAG: hypothetical protein A3A34_03355 [Candidatus Kaiserbacteria bacterium RIFCSPLOWO2_01_FULL_50_24]OGG81199.1 MAG: hypothetical protein A3H74_00795 [Candidatus Kaiserbacteria bacterium RIFCSPLOWO2_02_FULL_51_13]
MMVSEYPLAGRDAGAQTEEAASKKEMPTVLVIVSDTAYPSAGLAVSHIKKVFARMGYAESSVVSVPMFSDDGRHTTVPLAKCGEWFKLFFEGAEEYIATHGKDYQTCVFVAFVPVSGEFEEQLPVANRGCTVCVGIFVDQAVNRKWLYMNVLLPVSAVSHERILFYPVAPGIPARRELDLYPIVMHNLGLIQQAVVEAYLATKKTDIPVADISSCSQQTLEVMQHIHTGLENACDTLPFSSTSVM